MREMPAPVELLRPPVWREFGSQKLLRFLIALAIGMAAAVWAGDLCAQETRTQHRHHRIGIGVGTEYVGSRDEAGSPMRYEGTAQPIQLSYARWAEKWRHGVRISGSHTGFNAERLESARANEDGHYADLTRASAAYSLQRSLLSSDSWRLWLGPRWTNTFFYRSYRYAPTQIGSVEVWEGFSALDLSVRLLATPGQRHQFHIHLALPVAAYALRSAYGVRGDERLRLVLEHEKAVTTGRFVSWDRLQMIEASTGYQLRVVGAWHIDVSYYFDFYRYTDPFETRAVRHRVGAGTSLQF